MSVRPGPKGQVPKDRSPGTRGGAPTAAAWVALVLACDPAPAQQPAATAPAPVTAASPAAAAGDGKASAVAAAASPAAAGARPILITGGGEGTIADAVRAELGRGSGPLVVYVGASWCEPCRRFHDALVAGELDRELAGARFLEYDLDLDRERLTAAGYTSRMIPLFALPGPDGRASGRQIEGGIKGPGAARHIVARLVPLLAGG